MSDEEVIVRAKWPDAEVSTAFAIREDKSRRWMYCVMSQLKFMASRGKNKRVLNVGAWRFTEFEAWANAAQKIKAPASVLRGEK